MNPVHDPGAPATALGRLTVAELWSRRRLLAGSTGLAAAVGAVGLARPWWGHLGPDRVDARSPGLPATADEARAAGWAVVTDHGARGDGVPRPLGSLYASLPEARRDHPAATSLADELDGAAIQSLADSGVSRLFYPPGVYLHLRPIVVRDGQRHVGSGPETVLRNRRPRRRAIDLALAHTFQIGNIHPVAMDTSRSGEAWATHGLAPVASGDRTVRVVSPTGPVDVAPQDVVMVRSDGEPVPVANGVTYDLQMWNRVTSWDPASGVLALERPVPRDIAARSPDPAVLSGPVLCVDAGRDRFIDAPWSIAQDVEIARLRTDSAGLTARNGMWRGHLHDLVVDGPNMLTFNALVESTVERVTGTFSTRMLELKQASRDSVVRDVRGTYVHDPDARVYPPISIGEQTFACTFSGVDCRIGPECRAPVRALELASPDIAFSGTVEHRGRGGHDQVWAVMSSGFPAAPPVRVRLDLTVRAGGPLRSYGVIGGVTARPSAPRGVDLRLDQRTTGGPPPPFGVEVTLGSDIRLLAATGDTTCAVAGPEGSVPEGARTC